MHELGAQLEWPLGEGALGEHAPADALRSLEHDGAKAAPVKRASGTEPGGAGAYDDHIEPFGVGRHVPRDCARPAAQRHLWQGLSLGEVLRGLPGK